MEAEPCALQLELCRDASSTPIQLLSSVENEEEEQTPRMMSVTKFLKRTSSFYSECSQERQSSSQYLDCFQLAHSAKD